MHYVTNCDFVVITIWRLTIPPIIGIFNDTVLSTEQEHSKLFTRFGKIYHVTLNGRIQFSNIHYLESVSQRINTVKAMINIAPYVAGKPKKKRYDL